MKNSVSDFTLCDEYKAVERALRKYPAKRAELEALKNYVAALCSCSFLNELGASGSSSPEERLIEALERNPEYRRLVRFVETMETALNYLSAAQLTIVDCLYWRGMSIRKTACFLHCDHSRVSRNRRRILSCLIKDFSTDFY
ncbi:hypothetical protein FACS1894187_05110 [Synergistales bacterium]|nr:hypothetical protein FACS1894187_05110 [Synergistales bacterium]